MVAKTVESPKAKVPVSDVESPKDTSPKAVALDENGNIKKNMLGLAKKKPRAEYQAEIDELKSENDELKNQLAMIKQWAAHAPIDVGLCR